MKTNKHFLLRKLHRYLGLFIGLQFLAWTLSGLYFSWADIDDIHGDHLKKMAAALPADGVLASPTLALQQLRARQPLDSVQSLQLIQLEGKPYFQIRYFSGQTPQGDARKCIALADARTGALRPPLSRQEAVALAQAHMRTTAQLQGVTYLTSVDGHHEYRERPLPAWAVTFRNPDCTVYVSAELGTFQAVRHDAWRVFDFLWMFHTMDYAGRDDFNNTLLRALSVLALLTIISGFGLYVVSSPTLRKWKKRRVQHA